MPTTTESILAKRQRKTFGPRIIDYCGERCEFTAEVRYDDECGNGHNSFAITGTIGSQRKRARDGGVLAGGCLHDEVAAHFPELAPLIKWHLCSSDGPMHYTANVLYLAGDRELDAARRAAIWPEATDEELTAPDLKERLEARLPALLAEFRKDVEALGFVW